MSTTVESFRMALEREINRQSGSLARVRMTTCLAKIDSIFYEPDFARCVLSYIPRIFLKRCRSDCI